MRGAWDGSGVSQFGNAADVSAADVSAALGYWKTSLRTAPRTSPAPRGAEVTASTCPGTGGDGLLCRSRRHPPRKRGRRQLPDPDT